MPSIDGAFVPGNRGFQMIVDAPKNSWALSSVMPLLFINHGSQSTGVARAAINEAKRIISTKRGWERRWRDRQMCC